MSSPLARSKKNLLQRLLIESHQSVSHNHRVAYLSGLISDLLQELDLSSPNMVDIGCGDMTIAARVLEHQPDIAITCLDTYPLPAELAADASWGKYREFDGRHIPFSNQEFDVALLCDVLHHDLNNAEQLLSEAARVARFIIIKDHFEYGWYSRQMLRLMDFVGNWGYGVSVPERYFTRQSYEKICLTRDNLTELRRKCPVPLYEHNRFLNLLLPGKWQFVSVLEASAG